MDNIVNAPRKAQFYLFFLIILSLISGCTRSAQDKSNFWVSRNSNTPLASQDAVIQSEELSIAARGPGEPVKSPTPDLPHDIPVLSIEDERYAVQSGDTLGEISQRFGVSSEQIIIANQIENPNVLEIGQILEIPLPEPGEAGPAFKIIPNSEMVFGPYAYQFEPDKFMQEMNGYLVHHKEEVEGIEITGPEIIQRVSTNFSINPRLLTALLEYQSKWVTDRNPRTSTLDYPLGLSDRTRKGLYKQLSWAANQLNRGYYLWRINAISFWTLVDGIIVPADATINAGTAAVQYYFSNFFTREKWEKAVSQEGLYSTYYELFGYPFDYAYEPLVPSDISQPTFQLPFESGVSWAFTGGPHGGWGDGSAWAALDFAPSREALGCIPSDEWVVAAVDGRIVRAGRGAVVQDLDDDGNENTGWTVLYMHIRSDQRVDVGSFLRAGEKIGHPSCEGGFSTGTHLHIARRYNGEWIPADQDLPFNLEGWISSGAGLEYDGFLNRNGQSIEAWNGHSSENEVKR